jgi:hypothetical protein
MQSWCVDLGRGNVTTADGMLRLPSFKGLLLAVPQTGRLSATYAELLSYSRVDA